ncbi:D-glycero-alpha-D-manno-heptose-1,7-bisphosphate 7-phosphatase [Streptomyces tendae]|uniref:D-glycero-alpha-D-manno-heptose-1,7-bisphosphate 7-phosphatase n=1 Tax=Streptomyces tendae TaxID=1932 RepID=UPI00364DF071
MSPADSPVKAVLFDRDGTLVHDVPYNGDPDLVRPVDGAREAVALLRAHGIRVGVVTNQSGVARGLISDADVRRVNRRVDDLIGPFDVWAVCPHGPDDGCHCRKPRPGLVLWAAGRVCAAPADCVVIGDIGADTEAAERAGARGILVPNDRTRPQETAAAAHVAPDLLTAVRALLTGPPTGRILANERPIKAAYGPGPGRTGPRTAADRDDDGRPGPARAPSATAPGRGVFRPADATHRPPPEHRPGAAETAAANGSPPRRDGFPAEPTGTAGMNETHAPDPADPVRARAVPDAEAARARAVSDGGAVRGSVVGGRHGRSS